MQTHVIISYDGTDNDTDALALGRIFGDAGARVSLAYVRHAPEPDPAAEAAAQAQAEELLERGAQWLGHPEVSRHVVLSGSTGEGLAALAQREGADLIVFGSDWHTAPGHVQLGRSASRLIEGGPVSIAIAPAGLRDQRQDGLRSVALAGGEVDEAARATAEGLAARTGNPLALPSHAGLDLLVVGSRPGTAEGRVGVSAANEYVIETATTSVLIVARGVAFDVERSARSASEVHAQ
ncbi:MAG TPA: universal stress protein [Solirubrobacteraceae bacterium]|jgi:nucleotide-binding universal stress UspA family protein